MVCLAQMWEDAYEGSSQPIRLKSSESETKAMEIISNPKEISQNKEEKNLECPICFEPFDTSCNVPLVLGCGHTLCRICVSRLQRAVLKFNKLRPIFLPFFVSCPWCSSFSLKLTFKGNLKYPKKNYFVLWMVDSLKTESCAESNNLSCSGNSNHPMISSKQLLGSNQDELGSISTCYEIKALIGFLYRCFFDTWQPQQIFCIGFFFIFVALCAARVSSFILLLYAFIALLGSAFLLLPKLSFPAIGLIS